MKHLARVRSKGYKLDPPAYAHPCILIGAGEFLTQSFMNQHNITHVINCAQEIDSPSWFKEKYPDNYVCLDAVDSLAVNILDWYDTFRSSMKEFLSSPECRKVYVHCQAGMNRSAFLALMFVCDVFSYPMEKVEMAIIRQRPCALQNPAFRRQISIRLRSNLK